MSDTRKTIKLLFEGHPGHNGNVLGHAFIIKVNKLLNVLSKMERTFGSLQSRQTEYEIIGTSKYNPTTMEFRPVPKVRNYDPLLAFNWSINQIDAVQRGAKTDSRIDFQIADDLLDLANTHKDDAYKRFWLEVGDASIQFDDRFVANAATLVAKLKEMEAPVEWHIGVSHGSVTGELRHVDDEDGRRMFVIQPAVGPNRIECVFPEEKRALMNHCLFKTVRVKGKLHYAANAPFPVLIEMDEMEPLGEPKQHMSELRGLFQGIDLETDSGFQFIDV